MHMCMYIDGKKYRTVVYYTLYTVDHCTLVASTCPSVGIRASVVSTLAPQWTPMAVRSGLRSMLRSLALGRSARRSVWLSRPRRAGRDAPFIHPTGRRRPRPASAGTGSRSAQTAVIAHTVTQA